MGERPSEGFDFEANKSKLKVIKKEDRVPKETETSDVIDEVATTGRRYESAEIPEDPELTRKRLENLGDDWSNKNERNPFNKPADQSSQKFHGRLRPRKE